MSKGKFFTLIMLFLSISIVFGGWFLIREWLRYEEAELFSRSGQISMQPFDFVFEEEEKEDVEQKESDNENNFEGKEISNDRMEFVLNAWEEGGSILLHEPQKGQMNMEQAITTGLDWISYLSEQEFLPSFLKNYTFDTINASLCTLDVQTDFEKSLLSFWSICYLKDDLSIVLRLHAESGQIWTANISAKNDKIPYKKIKKAINKLDKTLFNILFPFLKKEEQQSSSFIVGENIIYQKLLNSDILAGIQWNRFFPDSGEVITDLTIWFCTIYNSEYEKISEYGKIMEAIGEEQTIKDSKIRKQREDIMKSIVVK